MAPLISPKIFSSPLLPAPAPHRITRMSVSSNYFLTCSKLASVAPTRANEVTLSVVHFKDNFLCFLLIKATIIVAIILEQGTGCLAEQKCVFCKATREALFSPTIRIKSICRLVPHTVDKGQKPDLYCELEKRNFLLEKELH